nr:MAG TPA: hypothetical protein [Caudoviricetes sp.]
MTKRLYTFSKRQKARTLRFALFSDGTNYFLSSFTSSKSASTTSSSFLAEDGSACAPSPACASACA